MRRNHRVNNKKQTMNVLYVSGAILAISIIAFVITFISYSNKLKSSSNSYSIAKVAQLVPNESEAGETKQASTRYWKNCRRS